MLPSLTAGAKDETKTPLVGATTGCSASSCGTSVHEADGERDTCAKPDPDARGGPALGCLTTVVTAETAGTLLTDLIVGRSRTLQL